MSTRRRPADAKSVADAKLVFVNGLGFEGWMTGWSRHPAARRRSWSRPKASSRASAPAPAARSRPWTGGSACLAVGRQRQGLCRQYPRRADRGRSRRQGHLRGKRRGLSRQARRARAGGEGDVIASSRRPPPGHHHPRRLRLFRARLRHRVHRAAGRLDRSRGLGASDVAAIITQIKKQKIPAVFLENITDPRLMQQIAQRDRRQDRRHALFRRADRREGRGDRPTSI